MTKRWLGEARGSEFGKGCEHFILMELVAHRSYQELEYDIEYWRTQSGLEVDYVLGRGEVAIEVKGSNRVDSASLRSLLAFSEEMKPKKSLVVCNEAVPRKHGSLHVLPWKVFLEQLWDGHIMS